MSNKADIDHSWQAPKADDSRSPCPALNALANHAYLPRDGKKLGVLQLTKAVRAAYNLSWTLAFFLALGAVITCGSKFKVDLAQLALHNKIEHDASLVHDNVANGNTYAPTTVNTSLVRAMIADSSDGKVLTLNDLGKVRGRRNKDALNGTPLDSFHAALASAEAALLNMTLGGQESGKDAIPCKWIKEFLSKEKLPEGWGRPTETIGIWKAQSMTKVITSLTPNFK